MTIQQLRYIVEVSKCNTISKAAENLYMTQPALSKAIKSLEDEFDIVILERNNSKIIFTPQGLEFVMYAKQVLERIDSMEQHFISKEKKVQRLFVSTQHFSFAIKAFVDIVNLTSDENFKFDFKECVSDDIIENVSNGQSDIGLLYMTPSSEKYLCKLIKDKKLVFTPLKQFKPHVFLRKDHPLANCDIIYPSQLTVYPIIHFGIGSNSVSFTSECREFSSAKQIITLYDRSVAPHLISRTNCYHIGTGCIIDGMPGENMTSIPLGGTKEFMNIGWISLKNEPLSDMAKKYMDLVKDIVDNL